MLTRFYLEEPTEHVPSPSFRGSKSFSYVPVSSEEENVEIVNGNKESEIKKSADESAEHIIPDDVEPANLTKSGSFLYLDEVETQDDTKEDVIKRVIFCTLGLNISFCLWGLIQERMLTQTYDGEYFVNSYGLVFMSRLGGLLMSSILMHYFKIPWVKSALVILSANILVDLIAGPVRYILPVGVFLSGRGEHAVIVVPVRGPQVCFIPNGDGKRHYLHLHLHPFISLTLHFSLSHSARESLQDGAGHGNGQVDERQDI